VNQLPTKVQLDELKFSYKKTNKYERTFIIINVQKIENHLTSY
jgi:hypothetical protein